MDEEINYMWMKMPALLYHHKHSTLWAYIYECRCTKCAFCLFAFRSFSAKDFHANIWGSKIWIWPRGIAQAISRHISAYMRGNWKNKSGCLCGLRMASSVCEDVWMVLYICFCSNIVWLMMDGWLLNACQVCKYIIVYAMRCDGREKNLYTTSIT